MIISPSACNIGRSCAQLILQFRSDDRELDLHNNLAQYNTQCETREHLHAFERTDEDQTGKLEDAKDHVNEGTSLSNPEQNLGPNRGLRIWQPGVQVGAEQRS
jgi:hypothetical protein